jgi:hypothetical protein
MAGYYYASPSCSLPGGSIRFGIWSLVALSFSLVASCNIAVAATVTIGTNQTELDNSYPFGSSGYKGDYQQVYSSSNFTGPVEITSIAFFSGIDYPGASITGTYILDLSTTSASVGTMSTTYSANLGANNTQVFDGSVAGALSFSTTPFLYDPSQGNLLLTVDVIAGNGNYNYLAAGCSTATNRVYNYGGNGVVTVGFVGGCSSPSDYGLETQFTTSPAPSTTPEPSSLFLVGTGAAGLVGVARRRLRGK